MSFARSRRLLLLPVLVIAVCVGLAAPAGAASTEEARLEATQGRLDAVRSDLDAAQAEQSQDAASFARAERQLIVVMEALNAALAAVKRQELAVTRAAGRLDELEQIERQQRNVMANRAVRLYKQGSFDAVGTVLTSGTPREALERTALVSVVSRADNAVVEQVTITQTAISAQRQQLKAEQETLERVAAKQRDITAQAEELRDDRALALAATSDRIKALQGQETHLEAESDRIAALARRAEQAAAAASRAQSAPAPATSSAAPAPAPAAAAPAPASAGGWVWPVSGPVTSPYGPRWGRMHEGIDIANADGTPIYAASAGTVTYAGSMGGYGNIVLIDHGGGISTAYAHQSAIVTTVGARVSAGQLIGRVGSTGQSTGNHVHFEVRVGGGTTDPMGYLP